MNEKLIYGVWNGNTDVLTISNVLVDSDEPLTMTIGEEYIHKLNGVEQISMVQSGGMSRHNVSQLVSSMALGYDLESDECGMYIQLSHEDNSDEIYACVNVTNRQNDGLLNVIRHKKRKDHLVYSFTTKWKDDETFNEAVERFKAYIDPDKDYTLC